MLGLSVPAVLVATLVAAVLIVATAQRPSYCQKQTCMCSDLKIFNYEYKKRQDCLKKLICTKC
jgi:hypothetical protein